MWWTMGIGIAASLLSRVFEPFPRAESRPAGIQGLGNGLSVVERLVMLHEGADGAFSGGAGRGSRFVVHLPVE